MRTYVDEVERALARLGHCLVSWSAPVITKRDIAALENMIPALRAAIAEAKAKAARQRGPRGRRGRAA